MKRPLLLIVLYVAPLALSQPVSAQYGANIWGANRSNELDIQKLRSDQQARLKRYAAPVSPKAEASNRNKAAAGPYERVDLAGRPVPGYAAIRDDKAFFGPPRREAQRPAASTSPGLRRGAPLHQVTPSAFSSGTPPPPPPIAPPTPPSKSSSFSRVRVPPPPPLPPPPIP